ncbi:MAG: nucleoside hydrolase [Bradymonadia bacterium]
MKPFVFDMETGDPDDFLTLALLAGHPEVDLRGVTITPGTPHQVGLVRWFLDHVDLGHLPVGAFDIDHMSRRSGQYEKCVSAWHYRTFGEISPSHDAETGSAVLESVGPNVDLVTGAALKNLGRFYRLNDTSWPGPLTIQGGFAGDNVVPPELRLEKFDGRLTCPTFNLNGDVASARLVFERAGAHPTRMVSKNVCHGVIYDQHMHDELRAMAEASGGPHLGMQWVFRGMESYLSRRPEGKKFHDPLAAMCALRPEIGTWVRGMPYRVEGGHWSGEWGFEPDPEGPVEIIIDYDRELFLETMLGIG